MNAGTSMLERSAYDFQPMTPTRDPEAIPSSAKVSRNGRDRSRG